MDWIYEQNILVAPTQRFFQGFLCVSAKRYCSDSRCSLCRATFLHTRRSIFKASHPLESTGWRCASWKSFALVARHWCHDVPLSGMALISALRWGRLILTVLTLSPVLLCGTGGTPDIVQQQRDHLLFLCRLILIPIGSQRKKLKPLARKSFYSQTFQWRQAAAAHAVNPERRNMFGFVSAMQGGRLI